MAAPRQDIRITKTQKALVIALLTLLENKSFQKISVNDICQEALVSRSTFYVHFEDKYKLLQFSLQEVKKLLVQETETIEPRERIRVFLASIRKHAKLFRNLFFAELNQELFALFQEHFIGDFTELLACREQQGVQLPGPVQVLSVYYAAGISGTLGWWIMQDFPVSTEEMTDCLYRIQSNIINPPNIQSAYSI